MNTSPLQETDADIERRRKTLVSATTRRVPEIVRQLNEWQYMERTLHRLMAAWGRRHVEIADKAALHRHVWDQAEVVRRLRERIGQFPGGKPDAPVHPAFEKLANLALNAPCFDDALDAIYHHLLRPLVRAYAGHVQNTHPVHDAPTVAMLHEINTIKSQHYFWYRDFRRRNPHGTDATYAVALAGAVAEVNAFAATMPDFDGPGAALCGVGQDFRLARYSGRPAGWAPQYDIMPYISADFTTNAETRRLFWAMGYFWEINLPDDQLRWLYYGHYMPWAWHHDVSRHLWDESRHGCSGLSRLQDWGIGIGEVGLIPYGGGGLARHPEGTPLAERIIRPCIDESAVDFTAPGDPMNGKNLYDEVFDIGMVAENGHFVVKNESYDDFREGEDLESAEMMLFDIIDETTHVQYAHRWLPLLADHAKVDNTGYRQRAARIRAERQEHENPSIIEAQSLPRTPGFGPWDHYQNLLARIRQATPLNTAVLAKPRSPKPM